MKASARLLCAVTIVGVLGSCSLFDYSGMVSHRYALVYGVTAYADPAQVATNTNPALTNPPSNDPNLSFPAKDAKDVASMLATHGYATRSRWVDAAGEEWLDGYDTGKSIAVDASDAPSAANILADIAALGPSLKANDIVVIYFSGHGMQDVNTSPRREYIVPSGGVYYSAGDHYYYGDFTQSIRDDELRGYLDALPTDRKVVILDTCNSGGFIGNRLESDSIPPVYTGSAGITGTVISAAIANYFAFPTPSTGMAPGTATVISAAGRDEFSYETPALGHGVMTYYLLQTPQYGDLNHDGHVTVNEAYSLIKAGIDQNWNSSASVILNQETFAPHISGGPIDFVLF